MIVTAMIFISFSMFDIFYNLNMAEYDRVAQGSELLLGDNLGSVELFSEARVRSFIAPEDIDSAFYFTKFSTILKTKDDSITVLLEATDLSYYFDKRPMSYAEKFDENTPSPDINYSLIGGYSTIIVGEGFARKNSLRVGQLVEIYVPTYNKYVKIVVEYIAKNEGIFSSPIDKNILVDFSAIGNQGQVNAVYLDFKTAALYDKYYEVFEKNFPAVRLGEGNSQTKVISIVKNNTTLLVVGLVFLIATMMFILLTSYLIVSRNRMSEMIVFKAVGATPSQVVLIMMLEVLFYSVTGGLMGLLLGRAAMGLAGFVLLPLVHNFINYAFWKYIAAFIFAVVVSLIATLFPIIKVAKKTIRELSSKSEKLARSVKPLAFALSSFFLIGFVVAYSLLSGALLLVLAPLLIFAVIVWLYCAISYVIKAFSWGIRKIAVTGVFSLASFSILRNKALRTVTLMIAVITVFSFLVFQVLDIVNYAVIPFRSRYNADYVVISTYTGGSSHEATKDAVESVTGVKKAGYFNEVNFLVPDFIDKEWNVYGVNDFETLELCSENIEYATKEIWDATAMGMVVSNDMYLRLGLKIGDTISINPLRTDYDDVSYNFVVIGIDHTITEFDRIGYCKFEDIDHMTKSATFLVRAGEGVSTEDTFIMLRSEVERLGLKECYALTYHEWALSQRENLTGVSLLLKILQIIIYLVGFIGVFNISIVTAYDRRNEIKLYKVSGMSNSEYVKFSFAEGLLVSLSGSFLGFVMSYAINIIIPIFASLIDKHMAVNYFPISLGLIFIASLLLFTGVWTGIAGVNRKRKIVSINERIIE